MNSIDNLATFFGWCTAINFGIIMLLLLFFGLLHEPFAKLQAKMFGISKEEAKTTFFRIFHQYRLLFAVLNVVPYFALKIMS